MKRILKKIPFRKILKVLGIIAACVAVILIHINLKAEIPENPRIGIWYRITPASAKNGDGSKWHGLIKKGKENKVIVYFFGGGMSADEYTAAHPEIFYHENILTDGREYLGIGSELIGNPFRDWTFLVVPYTTGDLHIGNGKFPYSGRDEKKSILYHYGYRNYRSFMNSAVPYVGDPEAVLVAGYSAGGFAAALLADDVMDHYFPRTKNATVLIDSSVLIYDQWKHLSDEVWKAPKQFGKIMNTENLICDAVSYIKKERPDAKVLFDCSVRDGTLSAYQNYLDNGIFESTEEAGEVFTECLKETCAILQKIPGVGLFIWDGIPYIDGRISSLTQHTIMETVAFYGLGFDGKTIADWVMDAVNGNVQSYGLQRLES